ncbi:glycoside hydrolase family 3 C-terminal domain-containing protein [Prevotella sp. E9-3]|uniref:beta-glucosidase family protein n=1 Tax=Prevotella sp. E9-3 TaxID=2913621 RepID=UPI001EDA3946|nr:glycoside hydrolase family 3 C-terminal domain-containing protein [Prevotella sp. E9-3]UKK48876.1 glycoside hydrolase family 3 C-terminal domain-containing protein [Prevotella sp. E9-3]
MKKLFVLAAFALLAVGTNAQVYQNPNAPIEVRIQDALSRMTVHEKVNLLHGQSKFTSAGVPRLGIRQLNMDDGPHGVREELEWNAWNAAHWTNDSIVAFPSLTCLAATWNRDLATLYGHSVSEEFAYRGKDLMLGPGVNIQRTPLNGRAFEYMGEDPYLAGEMVVPFIQAVQKNGVGCCLKHFVLNDQETDRFSVNVNVSERAMREIYLYPFEQAVKRARVWSIMGSYNLWQNVHCCHNDALLNGILKKEWQWDGTLVSDWGGTHNTMQAALGGLDIEMGTDGDGVTPANEFGYEDFYLADKFEKLVKEGKVPMSVLDEKASRVLRLIFRTGMNPKKVIGNLCSEEHYDACRQIGEEGIVLLKNAPVGKKKESSLLPLNLTKYKTILVVGENATRSLTKGGGSSELKTLKDVSPLEGLQAKANGVNILYAQGYDSGRALYDNVDKVELSKNEQLKAEAIEKARQADLIIFVGGLNKNHKQDCENGDRESYDLSYGQNELIAQLAQIQKNIVVVTFGGNPYAMPWIQQVPALVHCWYLGSEAGNALAGILTGEVNPSGKLPVTFAKNYEDYPYVKFGKEAYPGVNRQVYYKEDLFVGYRGFEKDKVQPLFPFGFGLSYTTFKYGKPTVSQEGKDWVLTVDITNNGKCEGKETVQLYVGNEKYATSKKEITRPAKELKDFVKLSLKPGETKQAVFRINANSLRIWDETAHGWKTESGNYKLYIGSSSADIKEVASLKI